MTTIEAGTKRKIKQAHKTDQLPKIRIEPDKKQEYYEALKFFDISLTDHLTQCAEALIKKHKKEARL